MLTAVDGREAVDIYTAHRDEIRAVVLDLSMRRMREDQALHALRMLTPDVRVVLTSGFDDVAGIEGAVFLGKPWTPQALVAAVREVLTRG